MVTHTYLYPHPLILTLTHMHTLTHIPRHTLHTHQQTEIAEDYHKVLEMVLHIISITWIRKAEEKPGQSQNIKHLQ